ncbi:uncharacterized protein G2W53_002057 [Senna tora]|uniref:Uncharacterized protein n=1 Tax=Senna tora TaxID=362788 RepID=A0A834XK02_9FABA|nr:uncharacterized protein G2W53_002057 [Senna tora]
MKTSSFSLPSNHFLSPPSSTVTLAVLITDVLMSIARLSNTSVVPLEDSTLCLLCQYSVTDRLTPSPTLSDLYGDRCLPWSDDELSSSNLEACLRCSASETGLLFLMFRAFAPSAPKLRFFLSRSCLGVSCHSVSVSDGSYPLRPSLAVNLVSSSYPTILKTIDLHLRYLLLLHRSHRNQPQHNGESSRSRQPRRNGTSPRAFLPFSVDGVVCDLSAEKVRIKPLDSIDQAPVIGLGVALIDKAGRKPLPLWMGHMWRRDGWTKCAKYAKKTQRERQDKWTSLEIQTRQLLYQTLLWMDEEHIPKAIHEIV